MSRWLLNRPTRKALLSLTTRPNQTSFRPAEMNPTIPEEALNNSKILLQIIRSKVAEEEQEAMTWS